MAKDLLSGPGPYDGDPTGNPSGVRTVSYPGPYDDDEDDGRGVNRPGPDDSDPTSVKS